MKSKHKEALELAKGKKKFSNNFKAKGDKHKEDKEEKEEDKDK